MARAKTPVKTAVSKIKGLTLCMGDGDAGFKASAPNTGSEIYQTQAFFVASLLVAWKDVRLLNTRNKDND